MKKNGPAVKHPGELLDALVRSRHLYFSRLDAALESEGLSTAKFLALQALAGEEEPLPLGQLAERLTCVRSNITQLVDRLEADELVQRVPAPGDRRSKRAAITPEGRRRFGAGLKVKRAVDRSMLAGMSPEESELLAAALTKLSSGHAP